MLLGLTRHHCLRHVNMTVLVPYSIQQSRTHGPDDFSTCFTYLHNSPYKRLHDLRHTCLWNETWSWSHFCQSLSLGIDYVTIYTFWIFLDLFRQRLGTHVRTLRSIWDHFAKFWQRQPWMSTALDVEDLAGLTAEMEKAELRTNHSKHSNCSSPP